jgi:hypothetical protein
MAERRRLTREVVVEQRRVGRRLSDRLAIRHQLLDVARLQPETKHEDQFTKRAVGTHT